MGRRLGRLRLRGERSGSRVRPEPRPLHPRRRGQRGPVAEPIALAQPVAVTESCAEHGGFYLGSIGGPAARLAQDCIKSVEVLEYPELGMEAVWKIEVEDFPAFIVVDDKGNDFFTDPSGAVTVPISGIRVRSAE